MMPGRDEASLGYTHSSRDSNQYHSADGKTEVRQSKVNAASKIVAINRLFLAVVFN